MHRSVGLLIFVVFVVTALASSSAAAQTSARFHARIVEQASGHPVEGAVVAVAGLSGAARTGRDGGFVWEPVPATPFHVIVVMPGGQLARPVLITALSTDTITIPVNALAEESISVLGAALSIPAPPAAGKTMLSSAQIAARSPANLLQALETVPGIGPVSEGHAAVPAIRGLARGRTLVLVDGGRVTSERRVGPGATFMDPSIVEGIDIARGPGSVAYGSDAFGGVISVRTRRAEPGSPLAGRLTGSLGAGIPDARGAVELAKGFERGGILFHAHARNAEDYRSPRGDVLNSGWEDRGFLVQASHQVAGGVLSTAWQSDFAREIERPRRDSHTVRFSYPLEDSHRLTAAYQVPNVAGFDQMAFTGFVGAHRQQTDQDRLASAATGRTIERADVTANDFHVKGTAERSVRRTRLEIGVDVNGRRGLEALDILRAYDPSGALARETTTMSVEDASRTDAGVYVQAERALGTFARVSGGLRGDRVTTRNVRGYFGDRSTSNTAASSFGAVTVEPYEGLSLTAQASRGFRDPVLSDRYFRGPSGRGFITGNPDLEPETSLQLDLAARYTRSRTQVAAYVYQYRISDLIERYQTGADLFFFRNLGRARLRGIELEWRSDVGRGYSLDVGAQMARGVGLDGRTTLDDMPPDSISVLGRKQLGERFHAQARLARYAGHGRPGPSEVASPGATLLDIGAGWLYARNIEVRGLIRNALDHLHYASADPRWVWAPGRSASVTLTTRF